MMGASKVNVRELSLEVLLKVLEDGEYSSAVIGQMLTVYQYLEKQERAFFTRLCEGTIERALELDYILNQFSKVKVKKMKPVIRNILRMGVYQLKYMEQVPDSAACNEAVKLAQRKGFHNLKGFVNGVLRNVGRNLNKISYPSKEGQPILHLSICYSMPEWIVTRWITQYGLEQTEAMLKASFSERPTTIRCNCEKISIEELKKTLTKEQVTVEDGVYVASALRISDYNYLQKLDSFQSGLFTVQDESSMLVTLAAGIKEGDQVVDVCAAPGGKSLHAAELLHGTGNVSARDLTEVKISKIQENKQRLGVKNLDVKVWDATVKDESVEAGADVVIADLPCSGLGVIGKKNDIKYKVSPERIEELATLQRQILQVISLYVKTGGTLIYSTCTVNQTENEENMHWIENELGFTLESLDPYIPQKLHSDTTKQGYLQLIPGVHKTDGFFLARFRKSEKR